MPITRADLERRMAVIRSAIRELEAQLNSAAGALQDCEHWLSVLDAPAPHVAATPGEDGQ